MEMTLKLPQNYVEIEEEEMMYLDGGWNLQNVRNNAIGLSGVAWLGWVGRGILRVISQNPNIKFWSLVAKMATYAKTVFTALPFWAKIAAIGGAGAAAYALGTWSIF